MPRATYWIIGGGRFGLRAAQILSRRHPAAAIRVVDPSRRRCERLSAAGYDAVCRDGIRFLADGLAEPARGIWVVAAAPVHVAFEWLRARLAGSVRLATTPVPAAVRDLLPNPVPGAGGEVFASNADFLCPPDCAEGGRLCTATGLPRPRRLFAYLRRLPLPGVKKLVIRSVQLAPGVGGLRPRDLFAALAEVGATEGPVLFATACKCHAVVHTFNVIPEG